MLIRPHDDASADEDRWRSFVQAQGFGHLVAGGRDRSVPMVVPTQFLLTENTMLLHLAKSNPIFACLEENAECIMSVAGDWAYIPGAWKAVGDEDPRRGIPTTYYGAVQLIGTAAIAESEAQTASVLRSQLGELEPQGDYIDPEDHGRMLAAIRGLTVAITSVRAKFKFGGNVDQPHRDHIIEQLGQRNGPGDRAAVAHMAD